MWYVYGIFNKVNKKIYIGLTDNKKRRIKEHNQKLGRHFTARYDGEWVLIYSEECIDKHVALKREKQLKSYRGREFIKKFIPR